MNLHVRILLAPALAILGCFTPPASRAHDTGSSYLKLTVQEHQISGRWEIDVHDLVEVLSLETIAGPAPEIDAVRAAFQRAREYVLPKLAFSADTNPVALSCPDQSPNIEVSAIATNLVLRLEAPLEQTPELLDIRYQLFFERLPQHRGLLLLDCDGLTHTAMFSPDRSLQSFELRRADWRRVFVDFGWQGIWHIWIGFDHILFLLALLFPSVLVWRAGAWSSVDRFREAFLNVFKIVTAFTVAHSITLSLAALEWVQLPSRWVESAIAASVLVAAVNNLRPFVRGRTWLVAFGFGLIHGFGFANVLTELGLPRDALAAALLSFNLGVEVGQLAIVAAFLPLAHGGRRSPWYRMWIMGGGSALIACIAALWMAERTLGLELLGF